MYLVRTVCTASSVAWSCKRLVLRLQELYNMIQYIVGKKSEIVILELSYL
jgi:hypothetical protein